MATIIAQALGVIISIGLLLYAIHYLRKFDKKYDAIYGELERAERVLEETKKILRNNNLNNLL